MSKELRPPIWRSTKADAADWFDRETIDRARRYVRPINRARLVTSIVDTAVLIGLIVGHAGPRLLRGLGIHNWALGVVVVLAAYALLSSVISAPLDGWLSLVHDKRWELSTQTTGRWVADQFKGLAVGVAMMGVLLVPVFWVIRATATWWLLGVAVFGGFTLVIAFVYPVLLMPVFNKFEPMPPGDLRSRVERVAELAGVTIRGAFTMDASKRSRRDNAFVAGYGPTKRVVVFDTMLEHPAHVVEQIVAHEIGHYRLQHILTTVPASLVSMAAVFGALDALGRWHWLLKLAGVKALGDPGAVLLFVALFVALMAVGGYFTAWVSRAHEREADLEALRLLRDPGAMIDVWRRLAPKNLTDLEPPLRKRLKASHPEMPERMAFAQRWAELNGVPVSPPPAGEPIALDGVVGAEASPVA